MSTLSSRGCCEAVCCVRRAVVGKFSALEWYYVMLLRSEVCCSAA